MFQPSEWTERSWRQLSGLPLEDIWLSVSSETRVFGWFVNAGPGRPVILWCHGNAGNISHRLMNIAEFYRRGVSVMIFDYRGYGKSSGTPSENGLYQDALAAYDFLINQRAIAPERLIVFGRSLGTSIAAEVTRQRSAAGLILEGAFPSIQSMADHHYLGLPASWFVDSTFNLEEKLSHISLPVLVIHGEHDTIVPLKFGEQVFQTARGPKIWYPVKGAGHNDVPSVGGQAYYARLLSFIQKVVP
ncbi:MAG: alpha/beta hydrolase [Nitrospirales bacterium]|nr:alpha/beta hydrolase [Nitrospirales bacterium]